MIIFAFDTIIAGTAIPNLRNETDNPAHYAVTTPFSQEFGFLRYLTSECIDHTLLPTSELLDTSARAVYPIHLAQFDASIDYFGLMSDTARQLCVSGQLLPLFYFSTGIDVNAVYAHLLPLMSKYGIKDTNLRVILPNLSSNKQDLLHFSAAETDAHYYAMETDIVRHVNVRQRSKAFTCIAEHGSTFGALMAGSMWYHGLTHNGYFSYSDNPTHYNYTKNSPNIAKWNKFWSEPLDIVENFKLHVPFRLTEPVETDAKLYTDAYWNVVISEQCDKTHAYVPPAVFNPIMNLQPFMVVGPQNCLKTLREMGYVTFSEWMDEGYDRIKNDEERMNVCFQMIYDIANLPHKEQMGMIKEMIPVLAHNQSVLLANKKEQYLAALNILMGPK